MTRRDYEQLAAALASARSDCQDSRERMGGSELAAAYVARALSKGNPRFDRARFLAACAVAL